MTTKYPAQVDTTASLPTVYDGVTVINAAVINRVRDALLATEGELGPHASGIYGNVRNRLDALEKLIVSISPGASVIINTPMFDGDIDGNLIFQNVIGIQGREVNSLAPDINNVYMWDGYQWFPRPGVKLSNDLPQDGYILTWIGNEYVPLPNAGGGGGGGSVVFSNDLSGNQFFQTVVGLQSTPLASTTPVQSAVPVYDTSGSQFSVRKLTLDDLGPAFAISSFSGGSTVEVGATVTNPAFTASYSSTPTSAQITNTDGTDSPKVLTTPFTSGTVTGAFTKSTVATVTFTLTAIGATTKTSTQAIAFQARSFFGIAGAGATSATASGNTAVLVGASGTLSNNGLASSVVNTSFGPLSPTNQKIYFLCIHTSSAHTFKDQNGFGFAFNAPTTFSFTNQNGSVLSYDLYESTNLLSTSFTITVVS